MLAFFLLLLGGCYQEEPLPQMMPLGSFSLIDQHGRGFGSSDLRGKVYVADFIFTSCPDICPVLSTKMANLHRRVRDDGVRFVSVTVDPEQDTPERLRTYAAQYRADARWLFLTGPPDEVRAAIEGSFRVPVGVRTPMAAGYDILHFPRFMLVDGQGILRGLYETDADGLSQLEKDIGRLLKEQG